MAPEARWAWPAALGVPPLVLIAVATIAPAVPLRGPTWVPIAASIGLACVSIEVLVAGAATPRLGRRSLLALPFLGAVLLALVWAGPQLPSIATAALVTSVLLAVGTITGGVIGSAIQRPGHLMLVAAISSLVDVFSVLHPEGPTQQLLEVEAAVSVLVLPWPMLGTDAIEPVLGVGDIAFTALYLTAARRHQLPRRRTIAALAIAYALAFTTVWITQRGIPALPFLGAAVVIAHPEARALPVEERRTAVVGVAAVAILFVLLFVFRDE